MNVLSAVIKVDLVDDIEEEEKVQNVHRTP